MTPGPAPRADARLVTLAVVVAFVVRAGFGLGYWTGKPLTHDEREYLALATNIWQGRGFTQALPQEPAATVQQFGRAPLYPLFLAPLTAADADLRQGRLPPDVPTAVKLAQAGVGALGVWLIAAIARRAAGARAAAGAALMASVYPPLVWIAAYALSEALYSTLALASVWVLGAVVDAGGTATDAKRTRTLVACAGALAGFATLTRPATLFFLPLAAWLIAVRTVTWRAGLARAAVFCAAACAVIAPWTIRNAAVHDRLVLIASEGGITFWTGNHPEAIGEGDLAANPRLKVRNAEFRARHATLSEEALEPLYYREALGFIAEDPVRWVRLILRKAFYTIVPVGPSYQLHSPRYRLASSWSYVLLLPLAILGARRLGAAMPVSLMTLALSSVLVCLVFFPQERFRIPVLDPTLLVLAAGLLRRK